MTIFQKSADGLNKEILKLAIPNILSNITIPLLGLVDTALMGHLDSLDYLGAIALGSMIFNIIYWSLGFLRMGTVGFTAQAYGAGDKQALTLIFKRGIFVALSLGILVIVLSPWLIDLGINLTSSGEGVKHYAANYVSIRIWAAPASLLILVFSGWFLGVQNAVYPMIIAIAGNVLNIVFSFVFVYYMNMNSAGAALGTVIAQYLSLVLAVYLFVKKYKKDIVKKKIGEVLKLREMKVFFSVNGDIFMRTLGIIFVISFFTIKSANISDSILAVNSILFQFFLFFSFMLDGFANAAEAMTGEYLGAGNSFLLRKSIRRNLLFGLLFSFVFSIIYLFFGENIIKLLTDNEKVIINSRPLMIWVVLMPLISFAAFIFDGVFIGATASKALRNGMIISVVFVFVPLYYFMPFDELTGLWIAFLGFMAARGLTLGLMLNNSVYKKV